MLVSNDKPLHREEVITQTKIGESNPRWDYMADFVNVPAGSSVMVSVESSMAWSDDAFGRAVGTAKQMLRVCAGVWMYWLPIKCCWYGYLV